MSRRISDTKIYKTVTEVLAISPKTRKQLLSEVIERFALTREQLADKNVNSLQNVLRSRIGTTVNDMQKHGVISIDEQSRYALVYDKPVAVRIECCEREIFRALSEAPMTRAELRGRVLSALQADKTASTYDDQKIYDYIGQIIKQLKDDGAITLENSRSSLSPKLVARADDVNALLSLKSEFLSAVHKQGGEFLENYFMALLERYMKKHGRRVLECYVVGGSDDGGIDGIIKTEDSLGFRETVMVQTKNRLVIADETAVRGFWGAVCARQGSRGIYVVSSRFHSGAKKFLEQLDNCVGVDGDKLFSMAIECSYGIKRSADGLVIDDKIL